jgi:hypothetical protein
VSLSNELISQFVKATKDKTKTKSETTVYGTVVYNGKPYVKIDGSDLLTPVSTTTAVSDGERVTVMIKDHTATVTGNISSPSARTNDVEAVGNKVSEFEIVMAYKVTTEDLQAANATIESLKAKLATITDLEVVHADIENLQAKFAELKYVDADEINAITANIDSIQARFGEFTDISTEDLEALNAEIDVLRGYTASFTYVSAEVLDAVKASIKQLDVDKLSAKDANIKYANIDFSNIGEAAIDKFYAVSGIIDKVTISEGVVVKELVGVTLSADLIKANTLVADKLVVRGSDGKYYKLSTDFSKLEGVTPVEEDSIHGSNIIANSITAEQISVDDLVAFDATIGGFEITNDSIRSMTKDSVHSGINGIYMDREGQVAFGGSGNFIKYYKAADGTYKLDISAANIRFGASQKSVDDAIKEELNKVRIGARNLIRKSSNLLFADYYFSGEFVVIDDGAGNVTVTCGASPTDDGNGNIAMFSSTTTTHDGAGNVITN